MSYQFNIKSLYTLAIILLICLSSAAKAQEITIFVDNWPPYNFTKNGKIVGISTELIELALQNSNIQYKLVPHSFKRALLTVERTPNIMLYTVARIPQREDMFAWIGPLHPRELYLYKLKDRTDIQINDIADLKKYQTGVLSGGSVEQFFISNGFHEDNYHLTTDYEQLLKMFFAKRIDLIPGDPLDIEYQMNVLKYEYSNIETAILLTEEGGYYMIANKDTPASIISTIQRSLEGALASGVKNQIIKKYTKQY